GAVPSGAGFYVAPNGNDSNAGTEASPFATLARAQQAMENSSIKATYVEGGTYHMSSSLTLTAADNGETWQYYPKTGVDSAVLDGGNSVSGGIISIGNSANNTIENCDIGFNTVTAWNSAGIYLWDTAPHTSILNNYVHDVGSMGIAINPYNGGNTDDGSVISGNVVVRAVQRM